MRRHARNVGLHLYTLFAHFQTNEGEDAAYVYAHAQLRIPLAAFEQTDVI
jgi:hypothetical protein